MDTYKCLSVCQPYAWLIVSGLKKIENRTWRTSYRGPLLIHAGKSRAWMHDLPRMQALTGNAIPDELAFGAIVGVAELTDVVPLAEVGEPDPHAEGPWCWLLKDARALKTPIPWKGQLQIFAVGCPGVPELSRNAHAIN